MQKLLTQFQREMATRLAHATIFGIIALLLGTFIPPLVIRYAPINYLTIAIPASTNLKVYEPGDKVKMSVYITSKVNDSVEVDFNFTKVTEGNQLTPFHTVHADNFVIKEGNTNYILEIPLSDKTPPGTYQFDGLVTYDVQGIKKSTHFSSGLFDVRENRTVPNE